MTKKSTTTEGVEPVKEKAVCMTFIKNVTTANFKTVRHTRAKLTQSQIDEMHNEIKVIYPKQSQRIIPTPPTVDCGCK